MSTTFEKAIEEALNDFGANEHAILRGEQKLAQIISNRLIGAMTRHGIDPTQKEIAFFVETAHEMAQRSVDFFANGHAKNIPQMGRHNLAQLFSDDGSLIAMAEKVCAKTEREIERHAMQRIAKQQGYADPVGVERSGLPERNFIAPAAKMDPVFTGEKAIDRHTPAAKPLMVEYQAAPRTKEVPFYDDSQSRYPAKPQKKKR